MAIVLSVRYNQNTRERDLTGDLTTCVYEVSIATGPNAYPLGGEPISFATEFREAHSVECTPPFNPNIGAGTTGAFIAAFERGAGPSLNAGTIRIYQSAGAAAPLAELVAGAYPQAMSFSIVVHGRPASDAS